MTNMTLGELGKAKYNFACWRFKSKTHQLLGAISGMLIQPHGDLSAVSAYGCIGPHHNYIFPILTGA